MFYICRGTYLLFQTLSGFLSKGFNDKSVERCKGKKVEKDLLTRKYRCILEVKGMSEEEIKSDQDAVQLSGEQLSEDQIGKLISRAIKEGSFEAHYILFLNEWNRPGSSFTDYGEFEVIYGEIEKIFMDHVYDYPTTNEYVYAILPKTKVVVILFKDANDYNGKLEKHETLYVFTYHKGWQSIHLH